MAASLALPNILQYGAYPMHLFFMGLVAKGLCDRVRMPCLHCVQSEQALRVGGRVVRLVPKVSK